MRTLGIFNKENQAKKIEDTEYNAFVKDAIKFGSEDEEGLKPFKLNFAANFRTKERKFNSLFIGVRAKGFQVPDVDSFSDTFTPNNFFNGLSLKEERARCIFCRFKHLFRKMLVWILKPIINFLETLD